MGGIIEELNQKPKENKRNKESREAFQRKLSEIHKLTSIQNKTAAAKDVVGMFNANGVRTRTGSTTSSGEEPLTPNSVLFGDVLPPQEEKVPAPEAPIVDEGRVYTFSELASRFKISDSILFRAMEQSNKPGKRRSTTGKSRPRKQADKSAAKQAPQARVPPVVIPPVQVSIPPPSQPPPPPSPSISVPETVIEVVDPKALPAPPTTVPTVVPTAPAIATTVVAKVPVKRPPKGGSITLHDKALGVRLKLPEKLVPP